MDFPKQDYLSELPFPSLGDLLNPRIEPVVPELRNSPKHDRNHRSVQKQWGTLLQAPAGTPFTQWWRSPQWKRGVCFILHSRDSGKESLGGSASYTVSGKESWGGGGSASSYYVTVEAGSLDGMGVGWGTSSALLDCLGVESNSSPDWLVWGSFSSSSQEGFSLRIAMLSKMKLF